MRSQALLFKCIAEDIAFLAAQILSEAQGELTCMNQCELHEQEGGYCESPCIEHGELGHSDCDQTLSGFRCKLTFGEADALSAAAQTYSGLLSDEEFRSDLSYRTDQMQQRERERMNHSGVRHLPPAGR